MLSGKLIRMIEANGDEILTHVLREIRKDPEMAEIGRLPEVELREWGQNILERLGHWLALRNEEELARHYEELGRVRFEESIPLYEAVRGLCILKNKMIDFVLEQCIMKTSVQLYAEEELEHRMGRFFDLLVIHLVRGYERAWRRAVAHAAV